MKKKMFEVFLGSFWSSSTTTEIVKSVETNQSSWTGSISLSSDDVSKLVDDWPHFRD